MKYTIIGVLFALVSLTCFAVAHALSAKNEQPVRSTTTMPKLSVQLWSVREEVKKDIKGTLGKLATLGFEGVEFAGEFGRYDKNPEALAALLKKLGLEASGAHISFDQLEKNNLKKTISFYRALGVKNLIIGSDERAWHPDGIDFIVSTLTALSRKLEGYGMRIGYHNHDHEFGAFDNTTYWDYLALNTPKEVVLQQDVGWTTYAGKDPVAYVQRYPGRTLTTHYKVRLPEGTNGKLPIIGKDTIDWSALLKANISVGGTKWIVVEQEEYPNNLAPIEAVAESLKGLREYIDAL